MGKNLNSCCQMKPKVVLETPTVHAWSSKDTSQWTVVSGVESSCFRGLGSDGVRRQSSMVYMDT